MSRVNRKRNKKYVPKRLPALPSIFGLSHTMKTDLRLPPHIVLDAFMRGAGTEEGAHTLAACVNLGAVLSEHQSQEVQDAMGAGLDAVQAVMDRGRAGQWGVSGDEAKAIGEALNLTADMQDASTRKQVLGAIKQVLEVAA